MQSSESPSSMSNCTAAAAVAAVAGPPPPPAAAPAQQDSRVSSSRQPDSLPLHKKHAPVKCCRAAACESSISKQHHNVTSMLLFCHNHSIELSTMLWSSHLLVSGRVVRVLHQTRTCVQGKTDTTTKVPASVVMQLLSMPSTQITCSWRLQQACS